MNVSCPQCGTVFRVDPAKVPIAGIRARCSVCAGVIQVGGAESEKESGKTEAAETAPATPAAATSHVRTERKSVNPFLSRDPSLRAKRLARALISDMVTYYPAKHSEGLRDGTLKILFRDEIKKSYDEYVAQVGKDFAESTSHFQDSLNEVLAGGKKVF